MSALYQGQPSQVCPRCKVILSHPFNGRNEIICYNCGYRMAYSQAASTSELPQSSWASRTRRSRSLAQHRAAILYFVGVCLVIVFLTFEVVHATGLSLSAIIPRLAATPTAAYPLPKGSPLFSDSFVNDASGWNLQSSTGNYSVTVGNSTLTLESDKNKLLWELLPGERSFSNFTLVVNAVLSKGDQNNGYGIYIRGTSSQDSDLATYYRFELYGDGSYAIFKGTADASGKPNGTKIVDYTLSSAIQKQGKVNHIMIIAKGPSMSLIVNGQLLKSFSDSSYTSGSIALFVSNLLEARPGAQVQFSQLAIYSAQA